MALPARLRPYAAAAVQRSWDWICATGAVVPESEPARRFRSFGAGSRIAFPPGAVFGERWIRIGANTGIGPFSNLAAGMPGEPWDSDKEAVVRIGDRCNIGRGNSIIGRCGIDIGDDVTTAPDVYITDHNHTYSRLDVPLGRQWLSEDPVRIGSGCWLGTGVVVLPGADIGRNVAVAANSVVRGVIPDHSVIAGAPARVVRRHVDGEGWVPPLRYELTPAPEGWYDTP